MKDEGAGATSLYLTLAGGSYTLFRTQSSSPMYVFPTWSAPSKSTNSIGAKLFMTN